jgi:GT2 family glycosyltransferase
MKEKLSVCAIIVTHKRPHSLSRLLDALIKQTYPIDFYIIIDDMDSPNVETIIAEKIEKNKYKYIRMGKNFGLFGGLYIGIKEAYMLGYDALWVLDDDWVPVKIAVEKLITVIVEKRPYNCVIYPAHIDYNGYFTEPISIRIGEQTLVYEKLSPELKGKIYEICSGPNIGPLLMKDCVKLAGLPRPDLFFCGESEYFLRIIRAGCKVYRYFDAIIYHKRHKFKRMNLPGNRVVYISMPPVWHDYYEVRNYIFVIRHYKGWKGIFLQFLQILFCIIVKIIFNDQKLRRSVILIKAIGDGLVGKLGIRIRKDI